MYGKYSTALVLAGWGDLNWPAHFSDLTLWDFICVGLANSICLNIAIFLFFYPSGRQPSAAPHSVLLTFPPFCIIDEPSIHQFPNTVNLKRHSKLLNFPSREVLTKISSLPDDISFSIKKVITLPKLRGDKTYFQLENCLFKIIITK